MCVYETDARGFCAKNGAHCAFAHGEIDKRPPVYDIRELQVEVCLLHKLIINLYCIFIQQIKCVYNFVCFLQNPEQIEPEILNGPNQLDKERNMMVDDPKWQGM